MTFRGDQSNKGWYIWENQLYALVELDAPKGYTKDPSVTYWRFIIASDGIAHYEDSIYRSGEEMRIANFPEAGLLIQKSVTGIDLTEEQIAAIQFEITDPDNNKTNLTFNQFVNGEYKIKDGFKTGTYTVVEKAMAPEGYGLVPSVLSIWTETEEGKSVTKTAGGTVSQEDEYTIATGTINVTDNSKEYTVSFLNKYTSASVTVVKVGEKNDPLAGAVFELKKGDDVIGTKTSVADAGGISFTGLSVGTYTLTEVTAPEGYIALSSPMTFVVNDDNTITWQGETTPSEAVVFKNSTKTVTIKNEKETKIKVTKVWAEEDGKTTPVKVKLYRTKDTLTLKDFTVNSDWSNTKYADYKVIEGSTVRIAFDLPEEPQYDLSFNGASVKAVSEGGNRYHYDLEVLQSSGHDAGIMAQTGAASNIVVTITLPASMNKTLVAEESTNNNTVEFVELNRADAAGNVYTYWVEEETPTGRYIVSYDNNYVTYESSSMDITITNTPEEEQEGLIEVQKVWLDDTGKTVSNSGKPEIELVLWKKKDTSATRTGHVKVIYGRDKDTKDAKNILVDQDYNVGKYVLLTDELDNGTGYKWYPYYQIYDGTSLQYVSNGQATVNGVAFTLTTSGVVIMIEENEGYVDQVNARISEASGDSGSTPGESDNGTVRVTTFDPIKLNVGNDFYWSTTLTDTDGYVYYVKEKEVSGYTASYTYTPAGSTTATTENENMTQGITKGKITVSNKPNDDTPKTSVTLKKEWPNGDGEVSSISYELYRTTTQPEEKTVSVTYKGYSEAKTETETIDGHEVTVTTPRTLGTQTKSGITLQKGSAVRVFITRAYTSDHTEWGITAEPASAANVGTLQTNGTFTIGNVTYYEYYYDVVINENCTLNVSYGNADPSQFLEPLIDVVKPADLGEPVRTGAITGSSWTATEGNLPITAPDGFTYYYYVYETGLNSSNTTKRFETRYTSAVAGNAKDCTITISNVLRPELTWIGVQKVWDKSVTDPESSISI